MKIRIVNGEDRQLTYALRFEVFVDEQRIPRELELDEFDDSAVHILAEEDGMAVACARILLSPEDAHIGRVAVKKSYRGRGVGAAVCRFAMDYCLAKGYERILLNAQLRAVGFYEKLGFRARGDVFLDAGIEHTEMVFEERQRR